MEIYVGKYVKIKSLAWFNLNRFNNYVISSDGIKFYDAVAERFCSNIYRIESIDNEIIKLQNINYPFSREFFDETYDSDTHDELVKDLKVGDKVLIKSLDWYNKNKNNFNRVFCKPNTNNTYVGFTEVMSGFCNTEQTIESITVDGNYRLSEIKGYIFTNTMFAKRKVNKSCKYKIGDKVKVRSIVWYDCYKNVEGNITCGSNTFTSNMKIYCGCYLTIKSVWEDTQDYYVEENNFTWTDEMFEGKVVNSTYEISNQIEIKSKNVDKDNEIIIPKFNINDVVTFTSVTTGKLYIYTIKYTDTKGNYYLNETSLIFNYDDLEKIGTLPKYGSRYKFCKGDKVRFLNSKEIENLSELNKKSIPIEMYEYIDKTLTIEYIFLDMNQQPKYKIVDSNEIWSGWMLKCIDKDNETKETTTKTNVLPDNKTKLIIIKDVPLNLKTQSEVKIHLKPKTIHYESYNT